MLINMFYITVYGRFINMFVADISESPNIIKVLGVRPFREIP